MSSTKQFKTLRAISHCGDRVEAKTILSLTQDEAERYGDAVEVIVTEEAAADAAETSTTAEAKAPAVVKRRRLRTARRNNSSDHQ